MPRPTASIDPDLRAHQEWLGDLQPVGLLVEFLPIEPGALVQAYFGLEQQRAAITGNPVDLVMADAVGNPYVRRDIEAGQPILEAVDGLSLDDYGSSRLIRSSVEREFIIIGEALTQLSRGDQALFEWGVIKNNLPVLVDQCRQWLDRLDRERP